MRRGPSRESFLKKKMKRLSTRKFFKSDAIPGASRLRNQNEILIEKKNNLVPFFVNTCNAYGLITLPLREGKIFCKKILGGG